MLSRPLHWLAKKILPLRGYQFPKSPALLALAAPISLHSLSFENVWTFISTVPTSHVMVPVLCLSAVQIAMGGFDNIYHHELTERLPWRTTAQTEQYIHSIRQGFYCIVFLVLAGLTPHGLLLGRLLGFLQLRLG